MQGLQLLNEVKFSVVDTGHTAGQTEVDSSILDMSGYDSVVFIAFLGTVTTGCVLTLTAQQNTANQTSGMAAIVDAISGNNAAASITDSGGATSNDILISEVFRPQQRYVRAALTRTTANAGVNGIIAAQFNAKQKPVTQDTTVAASNVSVGS